MSGPGIDLKALRELYTPTPERLRRQGHEAILALLDRLEAAEAALVDAIKAQTILRSILREEAGEEPHGFGWFERHAAAIALARKEADND